MKRILVVCLGNICRSPAAEAVLTVKARERGIDAYFDSAGTIAAHAGAAPDIRMQRAAEKRGYDLSQIRARRIELGDYYGFDIFLAMDLQNQSDALAMAPPDRKCDIRLLLDFADCDPREAPDPYYGGAEGFETVLDLIERASDRFLDYLEDESG